jgi:hypothetical protein
MPVWNRTTITRALSPYFPPDAFHALYSSGMHFAQGR